MPRLRPYQTDAKHAVYNAWREGHRNVLLVAPTGAGKTVVLSDVIAEHQGASIAIAHRQELVSQISLALARNGVRHRIIGADHVPRTCVQLHMAELKRSYYDPSAMCAVAGVDTLVRMNAANNPWFPQITLGIQDEAHHMLQGNKWGAAAELFPNARWLGVTATPGRADGKGLGRNADGLFDTMVEAPSMRVLIRMGYLTDYRVFAPPSDIDLSGVSVTAGGDFSPEPLRKAVHGSHIVGDVVQHYLRLAPGKLGVTFAVDVQSATEIATAYKTAGVPAEVVSAKTPDTARASILRRFAQRQIMQLVNVDLFGEGFDLPAIEVVSFARPTMSFGLYCLDSETEILTPNGWLKCDDAMQSNQVVAFDSKNNECRNVRIQWTIKRKRLADEQIFGIKAPHLDIAVSDNHNMLVKSVSGTAKNWQFSLAKDVARRKGLFRIPVAANGRYVGSGLTEQELKFIGWYLSDGNINKITNGMTISQSVKKNGHIDSIERSIKECGFKYTKRLIVRKNVPKTHNNLISFTISKGKPRSTDKHLRGYEHLTAWLDKSLPKCFDSLTRNELLLMLETWNLGDGLNNTSSLDYNLRSMRITCGDNRRMADRLQALCVTRGLRCNIATQQVLNRKQWFTVYIKDVQTSTIAGVDVTNGNIGAKSYNRSRFAEREIDTPFVWCVANRLGTLITRRNGKVAIVGNCQQFGRALRVMVDDVFARDWDAYSDSDRCAIIDASSKPRAIVIDHVGNVHRHGLPDSYREWSLDRRERRSRSNLGVVPIRTCTDCGSAYEATRLLCPYCGFRPVPAGRSTPEMVAGELAELSPDALAKIRGEIDQVNGAPRIPYDATPEIVGAINRRHAERLEALGHLKQTMDRWGGVRTYGYGESLGEAQRRFWYRFGVDVASAQALTRADADALRERIEKDMK